MRARVVGNLKLFLDSNSKYTLYMYVWWRFQAMRHSWFLMISNKLLNSLLMSSSIQLTIAQNSNKNSSMPTFNQNLLTNMLNFCVQFLFCNNISSADKLSNSSGSTITYCQGVPDVNWKLIFTSFLKPLKITFLSVSLDKSRFIIRFVVFP